MEVMEGGRERGMLVSECQRGFPR
jgi:hypothetical protein